MQAAKDGKADMLLVRVQRRKGLGEERARLDHLVPFYIGGEAEITNVLPAVLQVDL